MSVKGEAKSAAGKTEHTVNTAARSSQVLVHVTMYSSSRIAVVYNICINKYIVSRL